MSSHKRKLEEYHDPDYPSLHPNQPTSSSRAENPSKKPKSLPTQTSEERLRKVREIIQREFGTELSAKEQEVEEIERRLVGAKQLLAKVRYAVVYNYYTRKNLVHSAFDLKAMEPGAATTIETTSAESREDEPSTSMPGSLGPEPEKMQPAIHPSLKKLLGKRPIDYNELLKVRPVRQAAKTATQNFHKPKKTTKIETKLVSSEMNTTIPSQEDDDLSETPSTPGEMKIPRYVAPNAPDKRIEQVNSARGRNQYRHLIAVGNTSKYIGDEERDSTTNVTHKWLVYIATKTTVPIDKIVCKVRFFLHESYRPNDLVEVLSPPFQIAKRGWGEFPLRVQLFFHPHLQQKPIQILHNLVLDKKHSGLQTMGAETVVEIWLNVPTSLESSQSSTEKLSSHTKAKETTTMKPQKALAPESNEKPCVSHNLNGGPFNMKPQIKIEPDLHIEDTIQRPSKIVNIIEPRVNVQFPLKATTSQNPSNSTSLPKVIAINKPTIKASNLPVNAATSKRFIKCIDKTGKISLIEMVADPNNPKIVKMVLPAALRAAAVQCSPSDPRKRIISLPTQLLPAKTSTIIPTASGIQPNVIRAPSIVSKSHDQLLPTKSVNNMVRMSNGKVVVIDKANMTAKTKPLVQQSLLRPQISLLKPQNVDEKPLASMGTKGLKMITVNNLSGMENRNINVFLPTECESDSDIEIPRSKRFVVNAKRRYQLACELETEFNRCPNFANVTASVVWLLKRLPLISPMANQHDYKESFPFVVDSIETFEAMTTPRQRCYEWLRAKFIARLIAKHTHSQPNCWTTKQIILFARTYGYSPIPASTATPLRSKDDSELKNIIKTELMRERLQNDSISFNRPIIEWLDEAEGKLATRKSDGRESGSDNTAGDIDIEGVESKEEYRVNRLFSDNNTIEAGKLFLPIETRFQGESSWITDMCRDVQIRLQSEEIVDGVVYPAAQTALTVALRSFVEDLLRRSAAHSAVRTSTERLAGVYGVSSDDVQRALAATKHFDFLTNKRFGIGKNISS